MKIRQLQANEPYPMKLLLLADPSQELVENYVRQGDCYVAEEHHEIIGVYVLLCLKPETVELVNVAVAEEKQGRGLGKRLVQHALEAAKALGYRTIEVGTGNSSIGQLALYQKCGFRITGFEPDFFVRNYAEEIYENGIRCRDMIRLTQEILGSEGLNSALY
ncbi:GNAT family N-acetyltransferase [Paenibacillus donghaensis]|uniref:GNAT family N-acetyltransferase n=1 Tax=Paenibacillus donghaensis TaxID=414771 RepID=A0A2Z2KA84_9BACL|nr:GNAT family N-acetyltransferase [Paenibacillus donghaensis]ASA22474.1 GNAT family N-acetyltransferase [Paenibacillus donghaensis]